MGDKGQYQQCILDIWIYLTPEAGGMMIETRVDLIIQYFALWEETLLDSLHQSFQMVQDKNYIWR